MRLLFVTQDFPPDVGGIQTYSKELAPRLATRCERFLLLAPSRPGDEAVDATLDVPVHRLPVRPDLLVLRALPHIVRRTRHEPFDVALHVQWQTAFASLLARRLTGTPRRVAVTLHGKDTVFNPFRFSPLKWRYDALRRTAVGGADHVLPVSRFLGRSARELGVTEETIEVVSNATNPDVFYPDPAPALREELGATDRPPRSVRRAPRAQEGIRHRHPDPPECGTRYPTCCSLSPERAPNARSSNNWSVTSSSNDTFTSWAAFPSRSCATTTARPTFS